MKEMFKLSTMEFDIGVEYCFYNDNKKFFVIVDNNLFIFKDVKYQTTMTKSKWRIAMDIMNQIGYTRVKKINIKGKYCAIIGVKL